MGNTSRCTAQWPYLTHCEMNFTFIGSFCTCKVACLHARTLEFIQTFSTLLCSSLQLPPVPLQARELLSARHTCAPVHMSAPCERPWQPPALPRASISASPSSLASVYVQSSEISTAFTPAGALPRVPNLASRKFCLRGR